MTPHDLATCERSPQGCFRCARAVRAASVARGVVRPFYVVVYLIDRLYGGPEEGGWWWDRIVADKVVRCWDWKQALRAVRELREEYPPPKHNRYSVLGGTDVDIQLLPSLDLIEETLTSGGYE